MTNCHGISSVNPQRSKKKGDLDVSKNRGVFLQNGWFIMENPMNKWMIWGVFGYHYFWRATHLEVCTWTKSSLWLFSGRSCVPHLHATLLVFAEDWKEFVRGGPRGVVPNVVSYSKVNLQQPKNWEMPLSLWRTPFMLHGSKANKAFLPKKKATEKFQTVKSSNFIGTQTPSSFWVLCCSFLFSACSRSSLFRRMTCKYAFNASFWVA